MEPNEALRLRARDAILDDIKHRLEKLWRIFSWTSTLLIAMTGGTIALRTGETDLTVGPRVIIALAAVVLASYAVVWLKQNLRLEKMARDALEAHDEALGLNAYYDAIGGRLKRPDVGVVVGYNLTVVLLALGAIAAAFVPVR